MLEEDPVGSLVNRRRRLCGKVGSGIHPTVCKFCIQKGEDTAQSIRVGGPRMSLESKRMGSTADYHDQYVSLDKADILLRIGWRESSVR